MRFPEKLYQLTQSDLAGTLVIPYFNRVVTANGAAVGFFSTDTLAGIGDKFLVLTSLNGELNSGAAQTVVRGALRVNSPATDATQIRVTVAGEFTVAAPTNFYVNWSGELWLPPGWQVTLQGEFNAFVAANTATLSVTGLLVPRGSIQRL